MKSNDTLKWFPAQLPEVRIILGDAVVEVAKQGRPINTRTLLDYIEGNIKKKSWLDNKELLQTAISVLKDNQNLNGKM
ncbi:cold shock protein YdfK [Escherichia coli]|nr:cold shock protein YdfK [Escherichia coli]